MWGGLEDSSLFDPKRVHHTGTRGAPHALLASMNTMGAQSDGSEHVSSLSRPQSSSFTFIPLLFAQRSSLCLHNELLAGIIIHIIIIILTQMLADNEASERSRCAEK